jgi:hypothetical protein
MRRGQRGRARIVAVVALAVALAGPVVPAHAAGRETEAGWRWPGLAAVWAWFVDCGIMIDPDGRCAASAAQLDCGSHIDPNGGCAASSSVQTDCERGIHIDPNGGCSASLAGPAQSASDR